MADHLLDIDLYLDAAAEDVDNAEAMAAEGGRLGLGALEGAYLEAAVRIRNALNVERKALGYLDAPQTQGETMTTLTRWQYGIEFDEPVDATAEGAVVRVTLQIPTHDWLAARRAGTIDRMCQNLALHGNAKYDGVTLAEADDREWYVDKFEVGYEYARQAETEGIVVLRASAQVRCRSTTGRPLVRA